MPKIWEPPGIGWTTAITNHSWYKLSGDRAVICAVTPPKTRPAWDGGDWTEPELWTASVPVGEDDLTRAPGPTVVWCPGWIYTMHDKPHRITWVEDDPECEVLSRVPLPARLAAAHAFDELVMFSRVRRVHRSAPFEACMAWCHEACQRKHRWQALCGGCGWKQTRGRHAAAELELHLHHEHDHGGADA